MCGIAGIVAYGENAPPPDKNELIGIRDAMAKRGPDGEGLWISNDGRVGLAHRRLAIIDLTETGRQPMASEDGRFTVTFNGEIYNYQELRRELIAKGYRFRSSSDTEVLLALYADRGPAMASLLRGMYAFAIWDARDKALFLARDAFGIKPLYFADDGGTFRFASQVKALTTSAAISTAPEPAGHVGFFVLGSVPEPYTMYRAYAASRKPRGAQARRTFRHRLGGDSRRAEARRGAPRRAPRVSPSSPGGERAVSHGLRCTRGPVSFRRRRLEHGRGPRVPGAGKCLALGDPGIRSVSRHCE
jgi:asparagine synthase (glutamine-hydrolysing)